MQADGIRGARQSARAEEDDDGKESTQLNGIRFPCNKTIHPVCKTQNPWTESARHRSTARTGREHTSPRQYDDKVIFTRDKKAEHKAERKKKLGNTSQTKRLTSCKPKRLLRLFASPKTGSARETPRLSFAEPPKLYGQCWGMRYCTKQALGLGGWRWWDQQKTEICH